MAEAKPTARPNYAKMADSLDQLSGTFSALAEQQSRQESSWTDQQDQLKNSLAVQDRRNHELLERLAELDRRHNARSLMLIILSAVMLMALIVLYQTRGTALLPQSVVTPVLTGGNERSKPDPFAPESDEVVTLRREMRELREQVVKSGELASQHHRLTEQLEKSQQQIRVLTEQIERLSQGTSFEPPPEIAKLKDREALIDRLIEINRTLIGLLQADRVSENRSQQTPR